VTTTAASLETDTTVTITPAFPEMDGTWEDIAESMEQTEILNAVEQSNVNVETPVPAKETPVPAKNSSGRPSLKYSELKDKKKCKREFWKLIMETVDSDILEAEVIIRDIIKTFLPKVQEELLGFATIATNIESLLDLVLQAHLQKE